MYDRNFKPNFFADITKSAGVHILARNQPRIQFERRKLSEAPILLYHRGIINRIF